VATWTIEQVLALAPDPASAKAGQGLSSPAKWARLARSERSLWGEIQGSGKDPYRTQADLTGPAFHCSCPSRKFPCKHGLGLMLAFTSQPAKFAEAEPPPWVVEWLAKRDASTERKAAKATSETPDDPAVEAKRETDRARRAAKREDRVRAGMDELQVWLGDTVRHGLAHARQHAARSWDAMAARLVDAQAPGAARLVREMSGLAVATDDWSDRLLERLGSLHLLVSAHAQLDALPGPARADVRAAIGWTVSEPELADAEAVSDRWQIVGQRTEEEEKLRVQRSWLIGEKSGRYALVLDFAAPGQALKVNLLAGSVADAELVFYPSNFPLRAQLRVQRGEPSILREPIACDSFAAALDFTARALAAQPWLERLPWCVRGCVPLRAGEKWFVRDQAEQSLPLAHNFSDGWTLTALSGGHALTIFGEWNGHAWLPLSAVADGRFVALGGNNT
jgi:hypothetical protein